MTKRKDGLTKAEARAEMGVAVREAVLLPDGRVIDERRARERRRDPSTPIWIPALAAPLRVRFPNGSRVAGPFRATGHGVWYEGEGVVSWGMAWKWAVPECGVPVRVEIGNRRSGGYFPEELTIIEESADPEPVPLVEPEPEPVFVPDVVAETFVVDDEILGILREAGYDTSDSIGSYTSGRTR